jgi:hypothetical protein
MTLRFSTFVLAAALGHAGILTFSDLASFQAAAGPTTTTDFEGLAPSGSTTSFGVTGLSIGGVNITSIDDGQLFAVSGTFMFQGVAGAGSLGTGDFVEGSFWTQAGGGGATTFAIGGVAAVTSDASLDSIVQRFGLYPNDPEARRKLREHLYFRLVQKLNWKSGAIAVQFNYHDKFLAQKVTQDVVSSLIDAAVRTRTDVKVIELLDPASLAQRPTFPDRPMFASTGLFLGLGCAVAWGVWRYYKRPLPLVAAR